VSRSTTAQNFTVTNGLSNTPDFAFDLGELPGIALKRGGSSSWSPFYLRPSNGFSSPVSMSAFGLPAGVTAQFRASTVDQAQEVQLTVASGVSAGSYLVTLVGAAGNLSHTVPLRLTVH
jgi:hypothetical protein